MPLLTLVKPEARPEEKTSGNLINPGMLELSPAQDAGTICNPMYEIVNILSQTPGPFTPSFIAAQPYMDKGPAPGLIG